MQVGLVVLGGLLSGGDRISVQVCSRKGLQSVN
jgi:hypothetical protein